MSSLIDYFYKGQAEGNNRYHNLLRDRIRNRSEQVLLNSAELDLDKQQRTHEAEVQKSLSVARNLAHENDYNRDKREKMRPWDYYETMTGHYANSVGNLDKGMESEERMRTRAALSDINLQKAKLEAGNNYIAEVGRGYEVAEGTTLKGVSNRVTQRNIEKIEAALDDTTKKGAEVAVIDNKIQIDVKKLDLYTNELNKQLALLSNGDRKKTYEILQSIKEDPKADEYIKISVENKIREMREQDYAEEERVRKIEEDSEKKQSKIPPSSLVSAITTMPDMFAEKLGSEYLGFEKGKHILRLSNGSVRQFTDNEYQSLVINAYGYDGSFYQKQAHEINKAEVGGDAASKAVAEVITRAIGR